MRLYYTTTADPLTPQNKKNVSLGGYQSSTVIPNDELNNLFGDITPFGLNRNKAQYIGIMLKNETGGDLTDIMFHFNYPENCYYKLEIAAITPTLDSEGNYVIEHIDTQYSKPYTATFVEANGSDNAVNLGNLANNGLLGLFIKRTFDISAVNEDYSDYISKPSGSDLYEQKDLGTEDSIDMVFEW